MVTTIDILRLTFGIIGYASAFTLFLTPIIKFKEIIREKSTNESGNSFVVTLLGCLLVAWYGVPFVSKNNVLVTMLYGSGAIIHLIYLLIIIVYSPMKKKLKICGLITCVTIVFSAVVFVSIFAFHGKGRNEFVGQLGTVFAIIMLANPLLALKKLIEKGSVKYMSFLSTLFLFIFHACWYIYGLLAADPFIFIPNGVGATIGAIYIILYVIHRIKRGSNQGDESTIP